MFTFIITFIIAIIIIVTMVEILFDVYLPYIWVVKNYAEMIKNPNKYDVSFANEMSFDEFGAL